jgi:hypothetical protein
MALDLPDAFAAQKTLAATGRWAVRDPHRNSQWLTFVAPLEIDGVTIAGLRLRGTAIVNLPDEAVCFQLEYHRPRQQGSALARIEWRPIKGHNNKGLGPKEHQFIEMRGCHHHPFDLNWNGAAKQLRRGNLPIAVPIIQSPQSFIKLLELVGKEFRINGIDYVPLPEWTANLV